MASEEIIVSIGAKIDELIAGFNKAAEDVGSSLGEIETHVSAVSEALENKLAPAADNATEHLHKIGEESKGVGGALEDLKGAFNRALEITGIGVAIELFEKLKEKLDELANRALEFQHMGESIGVGSTAMQGLKAAAEETGIPVSRLDRVMFLLQQRMEQAGESGGKAEEKFKKLGIAGYELRDSSFDVITAMERLGDSSNTNARILSVLGSRAGSVLPILRALAQNHNLVAESAAHVNALLPSEIAEMQRYHAEVATLTAQFENFATRVLERTLPALREIGRELVDLSSNGTGTKDALDIIGDGFKFLVIVATQLGYAFKGAIDVIYNGLSLILDPVARLGQALDLLIHGKFAEVGKLDLLGGLGPKWHKLMDDFNADADRGDAAVARMKVALSGLDEVHPNLKKEEKSTHTVPPEDWSLWIKAMREALAVKEKMLKETYAEINQGIADIVNDERRADKEIEESKLGQIKSEQQGLEDLAKHKKLGWDTELAGQAQLIAQKLAIQLQYVEQMKHLAEIEGKDVTHFEEEKKKLIQDAANENLAAQRKANDAIKAEYDTVFKAMESNFTNNITKMIEHTETFGQAMRNIFTGILDQFIRMIVNMVAQWLFGMAEQILIGKTSALSQVGANAGVAASGAMASVAAIPYYGWAMAPEVGATTYAEAMAFGNFSAAGGFDVPSGLNPQTQLHEREMVLPANLADGFRNIIANQNDANQQRVAGNINFNVIRSGSQTTFNHDELMKGLRKAGLLFKAPR